MFFHQSGELGVEVAEHGGGGFAALGPEAGEGEEEEAGEKKGTHGMVIYGA